MKVGFIGTGTMGSLLIHSLIHAVALAPHQIMLHNRTYFKAQTIAGQYKGMTVSDTIALLAERCDVLFICVKPLEHQQVIAELCDVVRPDQIILTITSPVMIDQLESRLPAKIGKIIPSITNGVHSGVALFCFGQRFDVHDRERVLRLIRALGTPLEVEEQYTRIVSDLSSCGPAFLAKLLALWTQAAVEQTGISAEFAEQTLAQMVLGLGHLLTKGGFRLQHVMDRVAVPGGITATGLSCLQSECEDLFTQLTKLTHDKFREDVERVAERLHELSPRQY
jgi:competence protein ComER